MQFKPRAICSNWRRDVIRQCGAAGTMEAYQLQPPDVTVIPQTSSEVQTIHKFEHERKCVFTSGINSNERREIVIIVVEATAHQCFLI